MVESMLVEKLNSILTTNEATVLVYLYSLNSDGVTLLTCELADKLGVSSSRISSIRERALTKLQRIRVRELIHKLVDSNHE